MIVDNLTGPAIDAFGGCAGLDAGFVMQIT